MLSIAVFGGTFDPVHNAHIQTALNIQKHICFDQFCFLPCHMPVLKKKASATASQRVEMLKLALKPYPQFTIDYRELNRTGLSYMAETLESIRQQHPEASISLIMGMDAWMHFDRWHRWQDILKLANIVIMPRPGYRAEDIPSNLKIITQQSQCKDTAQLKLHRSGYIYQIDAGAFDISSTTIRQDAHHTHIIEQVPHEVAAYIRQHCLYESC